MYSTELLKGMVRELEKSAFVAGISHQDSRKARREGAHEDTVSTLTEVADIRHRYGLALREALQRGIEASETNRMIEGLYSREEARKVAEQEEQEFNKKLREQLSRKEEQDAAEQEGQEADDD